MIKQLQKRFVLISVAAVFLIMTVIITAINITSYNRIIANADVLLAALAEHDGELETLKDINIAKGNSVLSDTISERRIFTVLLRDDIIVNINSQNMKTLTDEKAHNITSQVLLFNNDSGFYDVFRYNIVRTPDGKMILLLDCRRELDAFAAFKKTSILISLLGLLCVFVAVSILSSRAVAPIEKSNEKQKQFITDASHELKTPLTIIGTNAELLEMDYIEDVRVARILNQVQRLTDLTQNLVLLTRMDENSEKTNFTEFSLSDAIEESVEPFVIPIEKTGKTIFIDLDKGISFTGDEVAIRQLISILLDNAMKYSNESGIVLVSLKSTDKGKMLCVTNTVEQIEKGSHNNLFERFYRRDSSRSQNKGGCGIGLSIAKSIVSAHKGKITAHSEDGKIFTITIKL